MYKVNERRNSDSDVRLRARAFCSGAEHWPPWPPIPAAHPGHVRLSVPLPDTGPPRGRHRASAEPASWPAFQRMGPGKYPGECSAAEVTALHKAALFLGRRGVTCHRGPQAVQERAGVEARSGERRRHGQAPRALGCSPGSQPERGPEACEDARATLSLKTDTGEGGDRHAQLPQSVRHTDTSLECDPTFLRKQHDSGPVPRS